MQDRTARIERCTTLRSGGEFCDMPSLEDVPFPICGHHALKLHFHLSVLTDEELRDLSPVANRAPTTRRERRQQNSALAVIQAGAPVIYAVRFPDGIVKIGCSANLPQRLDAYRSKGGELAGFMPGDFAIEREIHQTLREHIARGREWYYSTPAVVAIVNEMRDGFNLPHIAA